MEKRDRTRGGESVSIETPQDVVLRTIGTLAPKLKGKGAEGFLIAANLAVELGMAMKQDGGLLKQKTPNNPNK